MRRSPLIAVVLTLVVGCGVQPAEPSEVDGLSPGAPLEVIERAQDVADEVEQRNDRLSEGP